MSNCIVTDDDGLSKKVKDLRSTLSHAINQDLNNLDEVGEVVGNVKGNDCYEMQARVGSFEIYTFTKTRRRIDKYFIPKEHIGKSDYNKNKTV